MHGAPSNRVRVLYRQTVAVGVKNVDGIAGANAAARRLGGPYHTRSRRPPAVTVEIYIDLARYMSCRTVCMHSLYSGVPLAEGGKDKGNTAGAYCVATRDSVVVITQRNELKEPVLVH